ncbi:MAG: hypothetical protein AABY83_05320 [Pseudomonadota bacterium]
MRKGNLLNFILGVLLLAAAAIAWWQPGKVEQSMPVFVRLTQLTPERISQIHITRRGQDELTLKRVNNQWTVDVDGRALPAAGWRIDNVLRLPVSESGTQLPVTAQDLQKFALDPPLMQVKFDATVIALGSLEGITNRRYVLVNGVLNLIEDKVFRQLSLDPIEWIDLQLLPGKPDLQAIDLGRWRVAQDTQGGWRIYGAVMQVSADAATAFVDEWRYAQGMEVQRIDPKMSTKQVVTLATVKGQKIQFRIVTTAVDAWLLRDDFGLMYKLPLDVVQRLTDFSLHLNAQPR